MAAFHISAPDTQAAGLLGCNTCDESCCDDGLCGDGLCDSGCDGLYEDSSCTSCDSCGVCGASGLDCDCLGRMKLLGCIKPSERCFDDFISPMINFVFFEDPRTLSEVRPIFVHHNLPNQVGSLGIPGGAVQLYAMQFRIALTERLSLIAVKDGFIVSDMDPGPLDDLLDDGWAAVTAGLKYNLIRNTQTGTLASAGFTYELPIGSQRTLQDVGDGEFHVFATAGQRFFDGDAHVLTSFGYRFPVDNELQTAAVHWSNHFDVRITKKLYAVTEFAWWHWTESASDPSAPALGIAGQDLFNLTSSNVEGNDLVTQNVGLKYKPNRSTELGIAYEFPLTGFEDIIDDRFQLDMIFRY